MIGRSCFSASVLLLLMLGKEEGCQPDNKSMVVGSFGSRCCLTAVLLSLLLSQALVVTVTGVQFVTENVEEWVGVGMNTNIIRTCHWQNHGTSWYNHSLLYKHQHLQAKYPAWSPVSSDHTWLLHQSPWLHGLKGLSVIG